MPTRRLRGLTTEGSGAARLEGPWDVVVVGGGNAALCAAMAARHHTERVLLLERAPMALRGGNTRHTRNVRCAHDRGDAYASGSYPYEELWADLCQVGSGPSDEELAALTVAESATVPGWMVDHGIRWQPPLRGTLQLNRTNRFFLGGGKALVNTYYATLDRMAVAVAYDARVEDLIVDGDRCEALVADVGGQPRVVHTRAVVCASGGFEANLDWLARYWGEAARNYVIRGASHNDGLVLDALYRHGAAPAGEEKGFHAVAVDARAPRFDGGIATRLDTIPFGIVVNGHGQRFYDEGEDLWPKRYAIWGRNIAEQPDQIAFSLWDDKVDRLPLPPMYPPVRAGSIAEVAGALGLDPCTVGETVARFNAAIVSGTFDPSRLDDCHTSGLAVEKSHWAQPLDTPPYSGVAMRPGITFTYRGVAVDRSAAVRREDGSTFANVFAAGEIMSGNVLSSGYLAGFGLTIGTVWGRIAGREAARAASSGP